MKQMPTFSDLFQSVFVRNKTCFFELVARLAQSVEHETLNLRVVGSSPTLGARFLRWQQRKMVETVSHAVAMV